MAMTALCTGLPTYCDVVPRRREGPTWQARLRRDRRPVVRGFRERGENVAMTPDELAAELGVSSKSVRAWLRRTNSRSPVEKHQRWQLSAREVDAARAHFAARAQRDAADVNHGLAESPVGAITAVTVERFCNAPMHTRADVLATPLHVPAAPGAYGWWFRRLPAQIDTSRCLVRDGHTLLCKGISPRRPPANDRPPSRQTLRDRIVYHSPATPRDRRCGRRSVRYSRTSCGLSCGASGRASG
jgi:hypothetical protein